MPARPTMLIASTGGHLEELHVLRGSLVAAGDPVVWVTFDSPQSRSLLAAEEEVVYVERVASRGYLALIRALPTALRTIRRHRPHAMYSTGAGIALAFLPLGKLVGARSTYVESAARTDGPSVTGRLLRAVPWIELRSQYAAWAGGRWLYKGSIFDEYRSSAADAAKVASPIRQVVVTLGTQEGFPFTSLVRRVAEIVPAGVQIRWQLGPDFPDAERPDGARAMISRDELQDWFRESDVVIAHAGVGSALSVFDVGKSPVLVPRRSERGEHIDDHQQLIAAELSGRGLAIVNSPENLTWADVQQAAATTVTGRTA
jgi:UDP-N-acetylglucosamine--N-acetylmuramyl-(pentapeptide) pyrophosphoryl-undecaprenol N-acetylglucosamine transferase